MIFVVQSILFVVLSNTMLTFSYNYNPFDGLDCFTDGTKLESEEQAKKENFTDIRCYGWNTDMRAGVGHAAAILTLSWILVSIVMWIKIRV